MGLIGLEPMTLRLSSACSNQLSYRPVIFGETQEIFTIPKVSHLPNLSTKNMEARGFEPLTSSLQSWRSTN